MTIYVQYAEQSYEILGEYPSSLDVNSRLHVVHGLFTQTALTILDTSLECELPRMLSGKIIVHPELSWLRADDADANADLHLGYRAYVNSAGVAVVADDNFWLDNVDVGGGAIQGLVAGITGVTTAGARPSEFDAQDGLRVVVMIDTAMPNATDVIEVYMVYQHIQ